MVKKIFTLSLMVGLFSCEGSNETEVSDDVTKDELNNEELIPLLNVYGEDSIDQEGNVVYYDPSSEVEPVEMDEPEDLGYELGPIPEDPLLNSFGEDSLDVDGNYVFPPRDTIYPE